MLRQRASLHGDLPLFGAVHEVEEAGGSLDLRLGPDEGGKGEHLGFVEGGGIDLPRPHSREKRGSLIIIVAILREDVPPVVHAQGALAHPDAKLPPHAPNDLEIRAILVAKPDMQQLPLRRTQPRKPRIAAHFSSRTPSRTSARRHVSAFACRCLRGVLLRSLSLAENGCGHKVVPGVRATPSGRSIHRASEAL